jgi:hypothetical protein
VFVKSGKKPACLANSCEIVDIAGNRRLNRLVDAFLTIEMLDMSSGYSALQDKMLKESGLLEESSETILEMKIVLSEYREWKTRSATSSVKKR